MEMQKIIELSNDYYFIVSEGKIYTSEGYASDIELGEEFFDLTTINERPKGKWIIDDLDEFNNGRVWKCHCSRCNEDPLRYVYGYTDWWLCKTDIPKCCPSCGAEMEVE